MPIFNPDMLPPALIVFFSFLIVGLIITKVSGHNAKQRWYAQFNELEKPPEHAWVDNQPSGCATFLYYLLSATGAYIAVSLLAGHLLGF